MELNEIGDKLVPRRAKKASLTQSYSMCQNGKDEQCIYPHVKVDKSEDNYSGAM